MAAARKIGREYAITGTVQTVHIPVGDFEAGYTLINDGTSDIFWREISAPPLVPDGAAAVLIATPFFCSRLGPNEYVHHAGLDIYVVTDSEQQETSTLRVAPGRLHQSGDADVAQMSTAIGTTVDDVLAGETLESAAARTGISLWKRAVNKLIDIKALLVKGTAAMAASIGVTIATNDTQFGAVGSAADVDGNIHGQLEYIGTQAALFLAAAGDTTGLVFSTVLITEAVAGVADLGVVANDTDVIRLHGLYVTARAQCTVAVGYSDDVDGLTNYVALTGPETVGAGGAPHPGPDDKDPRGKLSTIAHATAKHMVVTFVTAGGDGYAIISKGAA